MLPLGISFFTFTQIAYLADVYGGYPHERSFVKYGLFVTYFPHLIAGPILHHREMMPQFGSEASRKISVENVAIGLTILTIGLFKKSVIADSFGLIANPVFVAANSNHLHAWTRGAAPSPTRCRSISTFPAIRTWRSASRRMFGIKLPFNFDSPYKSQSIVEFWRRWHISLSRFLRDYLYIPLGGNRHGDAAPQPQSCLDHDPRRALARCRLTPSSSGARCMAYSWASIIAGATLTQNRPAWRR